MSSIFHVKLSQTEENFTVYFGKYFQLTLVLLTESCLETSHCL